MKARLLMAAWLLWPAAGVQARDVLPFIPDDYAAAVAQATAKNLPLFVEAWAPW